MPTKYPICWYLFCSFAYFSNASSSTSHASLVQISRGHCWYSTVWALGLHIFAFFLYFCILYFVCILIWQIWFKKPFIFRCFYIDDTKFIGWFLIYSFNFVNHFQAILDVWYFYTYLYCIPLLFLWPNPLMTP